MASTDPFEPDDIPLPQFTGAHVIDQQAELLFGTLLVPEWIQRKIARDYGLDFEIEYSKQGLVTGPKALIQVKGLRAIPWTPDGRLTYRRVKVSTAHYWLRQNDAVMLVVADVSDRSAFYVPAKSYIRAHYETLLEGRPIPFHLDRQVQVLDRDPLPRMSTRHTPRKSARTPARKPLTKDVLLPLNDSGARRPPLSLAAAESVRCPSKR